MSSFARIIRTAACPDSGFEMTKRDLVVLAVVLGILAGAVHWLVKGVMGGTAEPAPMQPDSLLFFQYAKAIANGHAYQFTLGQDASTGSTSHLYPFVLSLLIQLGGTERLELLSFVLNCICHIISLALVTLIAWKLKPRAAPVALLLAALSGHLAISVHGDCDTTLFVPLMLGVFYAALCGRPSWLGITLALAPWTRPEGMVIAGALLGALLTGMWLSRENRRSLRGLAVACAVGVVSGLLVFVWNHHLTGSFGFSSTAHKNWFAQLPWTGALARAAQDFMAIWSGAFWGTGSGLRPMLGIPLLGAALFIAGFAMKPRGTVMQTFTQNGWLLGIVATTALVALSGWSGSSFDRYLAWMTPFVLIYAALGLVAVADVLKNRALLIGGAVALAVLQASGAAFFLGLYGSACAETSALAMFARGTVENLKQAGQTHEHDGEHSEECRHGYKMMTVSESGLAYYMGGAEVINFTGIVSPHMKFVRSPVENVERLKHFPWRRAPLLMLTTAQTREPRFEPLVGRPLVMQDPLGVRDSTLGIYEADYSIFDRTGRGPLRADVLARIAGMTNVCNLEVGFGVLEQKMNRRVTTRTTSFVSEPFVTTRSIGTNRVMEVGEVVIGAESFTIPTLPGRALRCVMRTASSATVTIACADGTSRTRTFAFGPNLELEVLCGGQRFKLASKIDPDVDSFDEISFVLPAAVITGNETEITVAGDHAVFAYWFFQ